MAKKLSSEAWVRSALQPVSVRSPSKSGKINILFIKNLPVNDNDKKTQNRSKLFLNTELTEKTNFDIVPTVVN